MGDAELRNKNVAIVQDFIDAINQYDFDKLSELLEDDMVLTIPYAPPGWERVFRGREVVLAALRAVPSFIEKENLHDVEMHTFFDDPGEIVATYKSAVTILPAMTPYTNNFITRWTVRDGKITYFAEYFDPIRLLEAMGGSVRSVTVEGMASSSA